MTLLNPETLIASIEQNISDLRNKDKDVNASNVIAKEHATVGKIQRNVIEATKVAHHIGLSQAPAVLRMLSAPIGEATNAPRPTNGAARKAKAART